MWVLGFEVHGIGIGVGGYARSKGYMVPYMVPYLLQKGSEVWALGFYRLYEGYIRGPRLRANMKGPFCLRLVKVPPTAHPCKNPTMLYGFNAKRVSAAVMKIWHSVAAAYRAAHDCDDYITKYPSQNVPDSPDTASHDAANVLQHESDGNKRWHKRSPLRRNHA